MATELPSLEGTLSDRRELPQETGFGNFQSILRASSRAASVKSTPNIEEEIRDFREAGLSLGSPQAISAAIENNTLSRRAVNKDIFNGINDLLIQREKNEEKRRENAKWTFEQVSSLGASPDMLGDDIVGFLNTEMGWKPGMAHKVLQISHREKLREQTIDELELETLELEQFNAVMEMRDNVAAGVPIKLPDGSTTYGTKGTGVIEKDSKGFGRTYVVDDDTGQVSVRELGYVGREEDGWEYREINNVPYSVNPETNLALKMTPLPSNLYVEFEQGRQFKSQAFTFDDGTPMPLQCGEFINRLTGSTVGMGLTEKKAGIDEEIDFDNVQAGNTMVLNLGSNGHVASVIDTVMNESNEVIGVRVVEANKDERGSINYGTYYKSDKNILGFQNTDFLPQYEIGSDKQGFEVERKDAELVRKQIEKADVVMSTIDEALDLVGFGTTGPLGQVQSKIGGTTAFDLDKKIDTIKANVGFQQLQSMRDASPTGGALGQVSEREINFLQATIASFDIGQSEEQLRDNLNRAKTHYENWKKTLQGEMPDTGVSTIDQEQNGVTSGTTSSGIKFTIIE